MNKLSATIVKNQPFQLSWHSFPYLRLKLNCLESKSVVTRELCNIFVLCRIIKPAFITICSTTLLCGLQYSILWLKKSLLVVILFFYFFTFTTFTPRYFSRNEADNSSVHFHHLITHMFHLQFQWNLHHYFYNIYPTSRPKISLK